MGLIKYIYEIRTWRWGSHFVIAENLDGALAEWHKCIDREAKKYVNDGDGGASMKIHAVSCLGKVINA